MAADKLLYMVVYGAFYMFYTAHYKVLYGAFYMFHTVHYKVLYGAL